MNWTVHRHKCLSSFLFFRFPSNWERGYTKFGIRKNSPQSYLSYFSTGFHWRIFLLSRANRLYAIFNTGLKNLGPSCLRYVFVFFTRSNGYGSVCHEPFPNNWLFFSFFSPTGRRCHFRFRVPANHLASPSFPLVSGDLRLLSTNICWYPLCDLHSFLTVTLWRLATVHSNGRIVLILFLSSLWDITWQPVFGFIYLASHSPYCIPWFPLLYTCLTHRVLSVLSDMLSHDF